MAELSENQKQRIKNIRVAVSAVALLGGVGGLVYAANTGGKFWRYVGHYLVGSLTFGVPALVVGTLIENRIVKEKPVEATP